MQNKIRVKDYTNNKLFVVPENKFIYSPKYFNSFSWQGEAMVNLLISVAPNFHEAFNKIIPVKQQKETADLLFAEFKQQLQEQDLKLTPEQLLVQERLTDKDLWLTENIKIATTKKGFNKPYYQVERNFNFLVPSYYKRTAAPRLTTTGSTFHGCDTLPI